MTIISDNQTIVIHSDRTTVVGADSAGPQGPPGATGPAGVGGPAGPTGPQGPPGSATSAEDLVFTYDVDGRLTDIDGETKYLELAYNVDGLLETVTDTVSGVVKTLAYDVDNRLVSITIS